VADEMSGFPDEPTFSLAALAGHELTQERLYAAQNLLVKREAEIARLENERDGKVREALLSLAAELERMGRESYDEPMFATAAKLARERAGVDPDAAEHASAGHDKPEHVNGVPEGSQGRAAQVGKILDEELPRYGEAMGRLAEGPS
jgi:hypothetical protein